MINSLKNEKKKLSTKVTSMTKKMAELETRIEEMSKNFKKEFRQREYYEGLFKEEREKNQDLQNNFLTVNII